MLSINATQLNRHSGRMKARRSPPESRRAVFARIAEQFRGCIANAPGDSILPEFSGVRRERYWGAAGSRPTHADKKGRKPCGFRPASTARD
jgi:hypothetical protein